MFYVTEFDSRLDYDTLTNMIKYVCQLLRSETDWKLVSAYLSIIASLERFNIIVNFVDESVRNGKLIDNIMLICYLF